VALSTKLMDTVGGKRRVILKFGVIHVHVSYLIDQFYLCIFSLLLCVKVKRMALVWRT